MPHVRTWAVASRRGWICRSGDAETFIRDSRRPVSFPQRCCRRLHRVPMSAPRGFASHQHAAGDNILILGDGDLSFSVSLARQFRQQRLTGRRAGMVATVFEDEASWRQKYKAKVQYVDELQQLDVPVMFGVDATDIRRTLYGAESKSETPPAPPHSRLVTLVGVRLPGTADDGSVATDAGHAESCGDVAVPLDSSAPCEEQLSVARSLLPTSFSRIVFNFPHPGGKNMMKKNRTLMQKFFGSARQYLSPLGVIHVPLTWGQGGTPVDTPRLHGDHWQVVHLAANEGLVLEDVGPFDHSQFPEYSSSGYREQDKDFHNSGWLHAFRTAKPDDSAPEVAESILSGLPHGTRVSPHLSRFLARLPLFGNAAHPANATFRALHRVMPHGTLSHNALGSLSPASGDSGSGVGISARHVVGEASGSMFAAPCSSVVVGTQRAGDEKSSVTMEELQQLLSKVCSIESHGDDVTVGCWSNGAPMQQIVPRMRWVPHSTCVGEDAELAEEMPAIGQKRPRQESEAVERVYRATSKQYQDLVTQQHVEWDCRQNTAPDLSWTREWEKRHVKQESGHIWRLEVALPWGPLRRSHVRVHHVNSLLVGKQPLLKHAHVWTPLALASVVDNAMSSYILHLDLLAMLRYGIGDIRLLWSKHDKLLQFPASSQNESRFKPWSRFPHAFHYDVSFWIQPSETDIALAAQASATTTAETKETASYFGPSADVPGSVFDRSSEQSFVDLVRDVAGLHTSSVRLRNEFMHSSSGRLSRCYHMTFSSCDGALSKGQVVAYVDRLKAIVSSTTD